MRYRYRLGKYEDSVNVINDPTFATGCGGGIWNCGANWTIGGGAAKYTAASDGGFLWQNNVFETGEEYSLYIENFYIFPFDSNLRFVFYIGDYSIDELTIELLTISPYQINKLKCLSTNTDLTIRGCTNGLTTLTSQAQVFNLYAYKWLWNNPIEVEPGQWQNAAFKMEESSTIKTYISSYIGNLAFTDDSYDYLLNEVNNFGDKVPILIENYNISTGQWDEFFEGEINVSEMKIDYKEKIIHADIQELGIGNYLKTNYSKQVAVHYPKRNNESSTNNYRYTRRITAGAPPTDFDFRVQVDYHNTSGGAIILNNANTKHQLYEAVELVVQSSRMTIVPSSSYLAGALFDDGLGNDVYLGNAHGLILANGTVDSTWDTHSFEDWWDNYGVILNLAATYSRDGNNIPTLTIEDYASLLTTVPVVTLDNVDLGAVQLSYGEEPKEIDIGYRNTMPGHETEDKSQYKSIAVGLINSLVLNPTWKRNSHAFFDVLPAPAANNTRFHTDTFLVEYWNDAGNLRSVDYGAGEKGQVANSYNENIIYNNFIDVYTTYLATKYRDATSNDFAPGPSSNPLIRLFEFEHPISLSDMQTIMAAPFTYVGLNGYGVSTSGLDKSMEYSLESSEDGTALTRFKILAE